jgi:cytochrome c
MESDLIRYGRERYGRNVRPTQKPAPVLASPPSSIPELVVNTPRHIGKNATDPAMQYAGNDLACQNCHLNAGLQPFAAPR